MTSYTLEIRHRSHPSQWAKSLYQAMYYSSAVTKVGRLVVSLGLMLKGAAPEQEVGAQGWLQASRAEQGQEYPSHFWSHSPWGLLLREVSKCHCQETGNFPGPAATAKIKGYGSLLVIPAAVAGPRKS